MKKLSLLLLLFLFCLMETQAQKKGSSFDLSFGLANPVGSFKNKTAQGLSSDLGLKSSFSKGFQLGFDAAYMLGDWGLGGNFGHIKQQTDLNYDWDLITELTGGDLKTIYGGVGPSYKTSFGKMDISALSRAGLSYFSFTELSRIYPQNGQAPIELLSSQLPQDSKKYLPFASMGLKVSYPIYKDLRLFAKADYFHTFGKGLKLTDSYYRPVDGDGNGSITAADLEHFANPENVLTNERSLLPQVLNLGAGLSYTIENPAAPPKLKVLDPLEPTEEQAPRLIAVTPVNNSRFKSGDEIKGFTWRQVGKPIPNANYIIEVVKVNTRSRQPLRTFVAQTDQKSINAKQLFKQTAPSEGEYYWEVKETTTGLVSNMLFFSIQDCDIDFRINNDSIECLGYVDTLRNYRICFDATYTSPTGALTYTASGLYVYDQTNTILTPSLSPTLNSQPVTVTTTESYCFEVLVDPSVSAIGYGLQGDDINSNPFIECIPGANSMIDSLPSCLCNACDAIELTFDNFTVDPNATASNQFLIDGNVNLNVPIYGIEINVQSYSYSAEPSACTEGVSSLEESGVILLPGTSINGETSLEIFNVTGIPGGNNDATKAIKYESITPITGTIPLDLNIGLPSPITGLDPSCCVINYEVCLKVRVFYEEGSCKSCVFEHCFPFNNQ